MSRARVKERIPPDPGHRSDPPGIGEQRFKLVTLLCIAGWGGGTVDPISAMILADPDPPPVAKVVLAELRALVAAARTGR